MASYLSSVLTSTTSRYNNLRRSLLNDEVDGDTEDDSHISRVLRAYYTEKGRPFPSWLPPDPKSARVSTPQYSQAPYQQSQSHERPAPRRGMGLSDLWDRPSSQPQSEPQSLRRGGAPAGRPAPQSQPSSNQYNQPIASTASQRLTPSGSRPLPSQREGSYQAQLSLRRSSTQGNEFGAPTPPTPGATAQDRLKARLWGGARSTSSGQGQGGL